jgi:hypothetical protein
MKLTIDIIDDFIDNIENEPFICERKKIKIVDDIILKIRKNPVVILGGGLSVVIALFFYLASGIGNNDDLVNSKKETPKEEVFKKLKENDKLPKLLPVK